MGYLKDKVAIVTGGGSGIGRALCEELSRGKDSVVIVADVNPEGARDTAASIVAAGGQAYAAELDVSQAPAVEQLIDDTILKHGRLDIMFNNAGISMWGEMRDMSLDDWRRILAVNLWGVIYGTTSAYRVMVKQGHGHIVNTASLAGLVPTPMETAYATTKHAVVGLSTSLRAEGVGLGVKISVVCPGPIRTGIFSTTKYVTKFKDEDTDFDLSSIKTSATKCARIILRGVEQNRSIITVTAHARYSWLLYRLHPDSIYRLFRKRINDTRSLRCD